MKLKEGQLKVYETRYGKEEALYFQVNDNEHWVKRYLCQGRYEVLGLLAVGGFGCVFVASDRWNYDNRVIIKTPYYMGDYCRPFISRSQEVFEKQIRSLNNIYDWEKKHLCGFSNAGFDSIVNLNDSFKERNLDLCMSFKNAAGVHYFVDEQLRENAPYLVMKYIPGTTLKELLPWDEQKTLCITRQILILMSYLHKQRTTKKGFPFYYLLCDLKAENIMICDNQVFMIDFGGVKIYHVDQHEIDVPIFVTDGYAAPEVYSGSLEFRDNPQIDKRFDIFTVGALMAHCLTGKHPQEFLINQTPPQHDFQSMQLEYTPFAKDIKNIILRATEKDRNNRYPDAESMLDDVDAVLAKQGY